MIKLCPQTKCAYNRGGGCQSCEICGTRPNFIDEDCDRCWNCANDEGILRWGEKDNALKNAIVEIAKEIVKEEDKVEEIKA